MKIDTSYLVVAIIWTGIIVKLFVLDISSSANEIVENFSKNQYEITYLFPLGRTDVKSNNQKINEEPVYFKVYAPRKFKKARIVIGTDVIPTGWQIGVQTAEGFNYKTQDLNPLVKQTIEIDVEHALYDNNKLRFILAYPDESEFNEIEVNKIYVFLEDSAEPYLSSWKRSLRSLYE